MRTFLTAWLPPIAWAAVILTASSDTFSSGHTVGWVARILHTLSGHAFSGEVIDTINTVIRKMAHMIEYAILSALSFPAIRRERAGWRLGWAVGAVLLTAGVASIDEIHQSFVPSRTGSWHDVVLDTVSATVAQGLVLAAQVLPFRSR